MGCAYGRDNASPEELAIQSAEEQFPISQKLTETVVKTVLDTESQEFLTIAEITKVKRELGLSKLTATQEELFQQFHKPLGHEKKSLILLGILLGQGTIPVKAKCLFSQYSKSNVLPRSRVNLMIEDMIQMATARTTILVEMTKEIKAYLSDLQDKANKASTAMTSLVIGEKMAVGEEDLIQAFGRPEIGKFLTCRGIRGFIKRESPV